MLEDKGPGVDDAAQPRLAVAGTFPEGEEGARIIARVALAHVEAALRLLEQLPGAPLGQLRVLDEDRR